MYSVEVSHDEGRMHVSVVAEDAFTSSEQSAILTAADRYAVPGSQQESAAVVSFTMKDESNMDDFTAALRCHLASVPAYAPLPPQPVRVDYSGPHHFGDTDAWHAERRTIPHKYDK